MAYRKQRAQWVGCTPEGFQELHQIIDLLREENEQLRIQALDGLRYKAKFHRFYSRWRRLKQGQGNASRENMVKRNDPRQDRPHHNGNHHER